MGGTFSKNVNLTSEVTEVSLSHFDDLHRMVGKSPYSNVRRRSNSSLSVLLIPFCPGLCRPT
jgi:ERCC4-related helicase